MINTITDSLMALWNSTWKGKVLPGLVAFIIVGVSMSCFFLLIKLPAFSHQPSALNQSSGGSEKDIVQSPRSNGHPTAVVTPTLVLTPTQASDSSIPFIPTPMPVQLPGIVSDPGVAPAANTENLYPGNIDINPVATVPVNNVKHARHIQPSPTAAAVSPVETTTASIQSTATPTTVTTNTASAPTIVATSTPVPTIVVAPTPAAPVPTSSSTPASTYPPTPISGSSPTVSVTATLAPKVATTSTVAPAITPMPTVNRSNATETVEPEKSIA